MGKLVAVREAPKAFKRAPKIPGVISDYVKGDSVRLLRACGAGSSCAPRSGQHRAVPQLPALPQLPARQSLALGCPLGAGASPRASQGIPALPRPWLWPALGLCLLQMLSPVLPITARWVLKRLQGKGSAFRINHFHFAPQQLRASRGLWVWPPARFLSWGWRRIAGILHKLGCLEESWNVWCGKIALLLLGSELDVRYLWCEIDNEGFVLVFA